MLDELRRCDWDNPEFRRQYQCDYRAGMRRQGYKRLDVWVSPKVWKKLYPMLDPACRDTHPGAAIRELLESIE